MRRDIKREAGANQLNRSSSSSWSSTLLLQLLLRLARADLRAQSREPFPRSQVPEAGPRGLLGGFSVGSTVHPNPAANGHLITSRGRARGSAGRDKQTSGRQGGSSRVQSGRRELAGSGHFEAGELLGESSPRSLMATLLPARKRFKCLH